MSAQRIGYLISGLIVLVVGVIIAVAFWPTGIGGATDATSAANLAAHPRVIDLGPFGTLPTGDDPGLRYEAAFAPLLANHDYRDFSELASTVRDVSEPEKSPLYAPIIKQLVAASKVGLQQDVVFHSLPIDVKNDLPTETFLATVGSLLTKAGASTAADKHFAAAATDDQAALLMGDQLWANGLYVSYRTAGLAIMADAAANLQSLYANYTPDAAKAAAAKKIADQISLMEIPWNAKQKVIRSYSPVPGDLANLAQHDADRSWRIEGTIWLGFARYRTAGKQRDAIPRLLQTLRQSPDPMIAQAAQDGLDLTEVTFRTIRID